ncbi:MAG: six-hairpin glycosidase-like protein [Bacteroidota bacterium]
MTNFQTCTLVFLIFGLMLLSGQESESYNQWCIVDNHKIRRWVAKGKGATYSDNIEMAGKRVAGIVSYEVDSVGKLSIEREVFFPQLHPYIKEDDPSWYVYRSYAKKRFSDAVLPKLFLSNKQFSPGPLKEISIDGMLHFEHEPSNSGLILRRTFLPSMTERLFVERVSLTNTNTNTETITLKSSKANFEEAFLGQTGEFKIIVDSDVAETLVIAPNATVDFTIRVMAVQGEEQPPYISWDKTITERISFLDTIRSALVLKTPDSILNTLFEFSKVRASESIFESKLGLIHSPGGGRYYVGIWANDQAEYVSPFFPYLGYKTGNLSAMNMYRAFAKETNPEYRKLPYAFEVEGLPPPNPLDRGDAAMIAYGASQYALASGDATMANELWSLIAWCLEYCHRQRNAEGVVESDTDEMENRIETGEANLSTSSLYYGALLLAADLATTLGKPSELSETYRQQANQLKKSIEEYFGASIEGLDTYRYYQGHTTLRHWICLPLVVGIEDRKEDTIKALFERLWSEEGGVHVEKNNPNPAISKIFWDRGTLYALRGTFLAGATDISLQKLQAFSKQRLLGNRVPYVVEAFPEGGMAHLSAESGLYCRVFIEGMFGIVPSGLNSFSMTPQLPEAWNTMALENIKAFGQDFSIKVERKQDLLYVEASKLDGETVLNRKVKPGNSVDVKF